MPYASQLDLENMYGHDNVARLADHDGDGVPEQDAIDDALNSATAIIETYLGARYPMPLTNPPDVVRDLCVDISWYRLAYNRLKQTAEMRQRYEDAIAMLKDIAAGKASLGIDTNQDGVTDDQSAVMTGGVTYLLRA